jgi:PPK2 family polyphosphate:nucleotide phosphotransferase
MASRTATGSALRLRPLAPRARLALSGRDAHPPPGTPDKDVLNDRSKHLEKRLFDLQEALYAEGKRGLLIVLQGRDASGKDGTIEHVFAGVNPQGCSVTSFKRPTDIELAHDYLWRIHAAVPRRGMIGIFNRSHYEDVLAVRVHELVPRAVWSRRFEQINAFERLLSDEGTTILKFFLHVSRKEQAKRLKDRLDDPKKNWKYEAGDVGERKLWDDYTTAYRDVLRRCNTRWAPWSLVPADDKPLRNYLVCRTIVETLERMDPRYPEKTG